MTVAAPPKEPEAVKAVCPLTMREVVDRVLLFIEKFSQTTLYSYQAIFARRIIESTLKNDGATITGLWSRQSGKTETIAAVCLGMAVLLPELARAFPDDPRFKMFWKGFAVGIYAPIERQSLLSFNRMRKWVDGPHCKGILADPELALVVVASRGDTIALSNGSVIIARTASPMSQVEGETHHLVVCEEIQKMLRSKVEKEIRPMLASTNGTMVDIGTAWESRGGFHHSIQQNVEIQEKGGPRNHFEFPYDIVVAEKKRAFDRDGNPFHLNYDRFVQLEITRLGGEDTEEFKMNFRCMWQESRVIAITPGLMERISLDGKGGRGLAEAGPRLSGLLVAGLDVAKSNDKTVLTLMEVHKDQGIINRIRLPESDEDKQVYYPKTIWDWLEMEGSFEGNEGQYHTLVRYLAMTGVTVLVVDATAMGDPVYERIDAMIGGSVTVVPYRFTGATAKHICQKYYMQELNAGRIKYAAGPMTQQRIEYRRFVQEHLDLDRMMSAGLVVYQGAEGGHDDYPSSACLATWGEKMADSTVMPDLEVSSAPLLGGGGSQRRGGGVMGAGALGSPSSSGRAGRYARRW